MSVTGCKPIEGDGFTGFACYAGNNSIDAIQERLDALTENVDSDANRPSRSRRLRPATSQSSLSPDRSSDV